MSVAPPAPSTSAAEAWLGPDPTTSATASAAEAWSGDPTTAATVSPYRLTPSTARAAVTSSTAATATSSTAATTSSAAALAATAPPPPPSTVALALLPAVAPPPPPELGSVQVWMQTQRALGMSGSRVNYELDFGKVTTEYPWGQDVWHALDRKTSRTGAYGMNGKGWWISAHPRWIGHFRCPINFSKNEAQTPESEQSPCSHTYLAVFACYDDTWYCVCIRIAIDLSKPWVVHDFRINLLSKL